MENNLNNKRLVSLDAFRGFTIFFMLIINNPGNWKAKYIPITHSDWHGINFADYIFPFFIFIMGISIVLSSKKNVNISIGKIYLKIIKRTVVLYLLGMFISLLLASAWGGIRFVGVLQKISIVYFFISIIQLHFNWKIQISILISLLILYWILLTFVPVPGYGIPSINPVNNLPGWLDRLILPGMLYDGDFDSEGIICSLASISTGIFGLLTGKFLTLKLNKYEMVSYLFSFGFILYLVGIVFGWFFPINKNLWTSSYSIHTSGAALMVLALFILIADIFEYKTVVSPFLVFGTNPIIIFVSSFVFLYPVYFPFFGKGSELIIVTQNFLTGIGFSAQFASLLWAIVYTIFCFFIPGYLLYRKKIFIKV